MKHPLSFPGIAGVALAIAFVSAEPSQAGAYIKFDGVDGEAVDSNHDKWCDLQSFSQGIHQPGGSATGATRRRGEVVLDDIVCSKAIDKASPKIAEAVCRGKVFPKVEIHLTASYGEGARQTYLRYELKNVIVTSYNVSGDADGKTADHFSLNFEEIKVTYTEYDDKGSKKGNVEYSWKVEEGES